MNEIEARETVAAWLSRDYHEELDPRIDIAPIVEAVTLVDAWLSSEQERIDRLDDAATTVEQARVDTLPRHRRLIVAAKPIEPFTLNGVEYTSMVTHRTPIECWRPEVGGEVCMGEWGHEVVHGWDRLGLPWCRKHLVEGWDGAAKAEGKRTTTMNRSLQEGLPL